MSVRSSTSNSDIHLVQRYIPGGRWVIPLVLAGCLSLLAIAAEEWALARRGFEPTIVDSAPIWARERERASSLGDRALILIGASRMQLDVDLDTMRRMTGHEPVQLAIDGSSFVPVLQDLANDERVTGTILVDYQDHVIDDLNREDGAVAYLAEWRRVNHRRAIPDFATVEAWLDDLLHRHLRSFADGSGPFKSLALRVFDSTATPQYLVTLPDRERRADYGKVAMPQFYYARVLRNAGITEVPSAQGWAAFDAEVAGRIRTLRMANLSHFEQNARAIEQMVRKIEQRGGQVVFIMFPRSGLVREADERMFPRQRYWNRFMQIVKAPGLHYEDVPVLAAFVCPDGAHLDMRDQQAFTRDLMQNLFKVNDPSVSATTFPSTDTPDKERQERLR